MRIYNAKQHTVILCGIDCTKKGWASGEFLDIAPQSEFFADYEGADGEYTRGDLPGTMWTVTFNSVTGSEINTALQALFTADRLAGNGAGVTPTMIRNELGTYEFATPESFIMTPAGYKGDGGAVPSRTWVIRAINPIIIGA